MKTITEEQAFHAAIAYRRNDNLPKLLYADWLAECGNPMADGIRWLIRESKHPDLFDTRKKVAGVESVIEYWSWYSNGNKPVSCTFTDCSFPEIIFNHLTSIVNIEGIFRSDYPTYIEA